jgi:hypothetical protein
MWKKFLPLVLIFNSAQAARPMTEMQGDCSDYQLDLKSELTLWAESPFELRAGLTADSAGPLELAKRSTVTLDLETQLRKVVTPEKPSAKGSFAGIVRFRPQVKGNYRIAAGSRLWIELVSAKTRKKIESNDFEMQTKCQTISKVVLYPLEAGENYWLQITGSDRRKVDLLVMEEGPKATAPINTESTPQPKP